MKPIHLIPAAVLSSLIATTAYSGDYAVSRSVQLSAPSTEVWHVVGDFCDVDDWHPAFSACATKVIDGALHRVLTTTTGDAFIEQRIATEAGLSYTYKIISSPLPVQKYTATLSVEPRDGTLVTWSGRFSSDDPATEGMVAGTFEAGLAAIEAHFKAN